MQVDLVLAGAGTYWRKRVELGAPPAAGAEVVVVRRPSVVGVVVGSSTPFDDDGSVAAVLLRTGVAPGDVSEGLHREGWRPLL